MMEALGSAAIGAMTLFGYNRKNFMYDRKMRQEQEFTIAEMRLKQADLWREDVRDITELTERKMDTYLIVNALQLGFTITLMIEGRLEQGTPQWLLWLYLLSLSGAFMFLLLSVWLAMHASVVAQGSSVRMLTQLVRLPLPSWEQLESMRTYAASFEAVPTGQMMRVPIAQTIVEGVKGGSGGYSDDVDGVGRGATDPWGLERRGDDIYELSRGPLTSTRHVRMLREASRHWRSYDAFARASLSLGTVLMCQSIGYFIIGYALINAGAPWAAWSVMGMMLAIASTVLRMDMSMARSEYYRCQGLMVAGPVIACVAAADWATWNLTVQHWASMLLPFSYLLHAMFLLFFLRLCRIAEQPDGSMLPTSFQSVLYLDIFGWLARGGKPKPPPREPLMPSEADGFATVKAPEGYQGLKLVDFTDTCRDITTLAGQSFEFEPLLTPAEPACSSRDRGCEERGLERLSERLQDFKGEGITERSSCSGRLGAESDTTASFTIARGLQPSSSERGEACAPGCSDRSTDIGTDPAGPPVSFGPGGRLRGTAVWFRDQDDESDTSSATPVGRLSSDERAAIRRRRSYVALAGQNMPRHLLDSTRPKALRPEDVEIHAVHGGETTEEESSEEDADSPGHRHHQHHTMEGVGPAGIIPQASEVTFEPNTFAQDVSPAFGADGDEDAAATGRDLFEPGKLPWHVFRSGIRFLAGLWLLGFLWAVAQALGLPDVPDKVLPSSVSVSQEKRSPGSESGWASGYKEPSELPEGSQVSATWPSERFQPRGLSADPTGNYLAIADEFDIYFASLEEQEVADNSSTTYRLANFRPAPYCAALEGQANRDVAVLCQSPGSDSPVAEPSCEVMVLHARGHRVAACRLSPGEAEGADAAGAATADSSDGEAEADADHKNNIWTVSGKWLRDLGDGRKREEVISVVVDTDCPTSDSLDEKDSCVVVGTNHGRMVQLRRHMRHSSELVPAGALWNVLGKAALEEQVDGLATSLMTAIPGGLVLALREGQHNVHAIDVQNKKVVGKWRVPQLHGRTWTAIAGGAKHLYLANQGGACGNIPERWLDAKGYSCKAYSERKWCTSTGEYGTKWFLLWGHFSRYQNFGQTASTACCDCGGGDREDRTASSQIWRFPLPQELVKIVEERMRQPQDANAWTDERAEAVSG
mmetsp:Transcript_110741/g.352787  ORF Transcript_110741/g.352787 Transcript_110741/m.352787 type:complete len:1159 (-) Transcript_110741:110-3586(-)